MFKALYVIYCWLRALQIMLVDIRMCYEDSDMLDEHMNILVTV
jgi:hypothetical protein